MMNWIYENWLLLTVVLAFIVVIANYVKNFTSMPSDEQIKKVKEWLVWACVEAEKSLASGTGQIKLRHVYNLFCSVPSFTWVAKAVSFETFSEWVSESLEKAKTMIVSNDNLAGYVYGESKEQEVAKLESQLNEV